MSMDGVVLRVDAHCHTASRDDVKLDNAELGAMESDSCHATESNAYVTRPAECDVSNSQLQSSVLPENVSQQRSRSSHWCRVAKGWYNSLSGCCPAGSLLQNSCKLPALTDTNQEHCK